MSVSSFLSRYARLLSVVVVLTLVSSPSRGARPPSKDPSPSPKYWILLADRPHAPAGTTAHTAPVAARYLDQLRTLGVQPVVRSRWLHAVSAPLSSSLRATVAAQPFVRRVVPVAQGSPAAQGRPVARPDSTALSSRLAPSPRLGDAEAHLSRINAVAPLQRGLNGRGVRVGFLDANYQGLRHPAFATLRAEGRLLGLRNFTEGTQGGNHGAGVASVAVGYDPGTLVGPAYGAKVLGATTEYTPSERNVEEDYFVAGLEWLHRRGADVVNVSVGYNTFDEGQDSYTTEDLDGNTGITTRAVDRAAQLGMTVVVSAGNSGCASPDSCWYYVNTPADADSAITVGAITADSTLADFSSRGPTADGRHKPDVVVQGTKIVAAWDGDRYARLGGTSFASPQVTGIVAQMLQVNPTLTPMQIRRLLRNTASQSNNPDNRRGWGIVNADAAIRAAERRARATPPPSLVVEPPYPAPADSQLTVPVRVPARTSSLRLSLVSPLGTTVLTKTYAPEPGPNWLTVDLRSVPSGLYLYRLIGPEDQKTGTIVVAH